MASGPSIRDVLNPPSGGAGAAAILAGAPGREHVLVRPIADASHPPGPGKYYAGDDADAPDDRRRDCTVLLGAGRRDRARELLAAGYGGVLLGDAALEDSTVVVRLAAEFGAERIGVVASCVRAEIGWSMDAETNADFRFMRPSRCEPDWEIVTSEGGRTGMLVRPWLREMFRLGAQVAMIRMDVLDDADLNIAAGLAEDHGARLWFAPAGGRTAAIEDWVRFGQVRRIAWPAATWDEHPCLADWRAGESRPAADVMEQAA
jgi:hypothetical protein